MVSKTTGIHLPQKLLIPLNALGKMGDTDSHTKLPIGACKPNSQRVNYSVLRLLKTWQNKLKGYFVSEHCLP